MLTATDLPRKVAAIFSGLIPVDAAAEVDGGEVLSGGGGARAAAEVARGGRQRREKNKGISEQAGAKIKET